MTAARKSTAKTASSRSPAAKTTATRSPAAKTAAPDAASSDVEAFLRDLEHPGKAAYAKLRALVLAASPDVREGIKWKAPNFRTTDDFATFHLRHKDGVAMILHTGAKVKASAENGVPVADPEGLLTWLAKDRAIVTFPDARAVDAKKSALTALLRAWIALV